MRKLMLISAFVLASVSAQAGESRGLVLAANDEPQATERVETAKPAEAQPEAAKPRATTSTAKPQVRRHESDEAKARRIAARYGIYW